MVIDVSVKVTLPSVATVAMEAVPLIFFYVGLPPIKIFEARYFVVLRQNRETFLPIIEREIQLDIRQIPTKERKATVDLDLTVHNAKNNPVSSDKNQF